MVQISEEGVKMATMDNRNTTPGVATYQKSKVYEPGSDNIYNNGEYQGNSHGQDRAAQCYSIEDSSLSSVNTASKKSR